MKSGVYLELQRKEWLHKNKHNDNTYPFKALTEWGVSNFFSPLKIS